MRMLTYFGEILEVLIFTKDTISRGATYDDFSGQFFRIFEITIFCFIVAICDLVHDVETIFRLSNVLTAPGNLF